MATPFKTFRAIRRFVTPAWLRTGDGELIGYALDLMRDAMAEAWRLGLLIRFPQQDPTGTPGPEDAISAMGRDRRVQRGINETTTAYAARLKNWLVYRRTCGGAFSLLRQIVFYCGTGTACKTVDVRGNWFQIDANGVETYSLNTANWNWDDYVGTRRWGRFFVIVYPGSLWNTTTHDWGDADLDWDDDDLAWGSTITPNQATTLRSIVNDYKPAGTRCQGIILAFDAASFNSASPEPDGTYGRWSKTVDGVRVASRLSTARYLSGGAV